jgi:hypothetical protein
VWKSAGNERFWRRRPDRGIPMHHIMSLHCDERFFSQSGLPPSVTNSKRGFILKKRVSSLLRMSADSILSASTRFYPKIGFLRVHLMLIRGGT